MVVFWDNTNNVLPSANYQLVMRIVFLSSVLFFAFMMIRAKVVDFGIKNEKLTSRKANPQSLYPSVFFDLKDEVAMALENKIAAQATVHSEAGGSIATTVKEIISAYKKCVDPQKLPEIKRKVTLCKKTIESEKQSFLIDNGEETADFNLNRQNQLSDYVLTGITIPVVMSAISIDAQDISTLITTLRNNFVFMFFLSLFLYIFSFRVYKYYHNKRSMMRSNATAILYNKAELMLCCFETALAEIEEKPTEKTSLSNNNARKKG